MSLKDRQLAWEVGDRPRLPLTAIDNREAPAAEIWPSTIPASDFGLKGIDVFTNTDCPYLCDHCFFTTQELHTRDRMSTETVEDILRWSVQPGSKIEEITLLGGEFSVHPQAAEIVKLVGNTQRADGSFLRPRIVTNGGRPFRTLLEDEEVVGILQKSRVAVSIEAADSELNDRFRGKGSSKNAWQTVDLLVQKKIPVDINCTVMRSTEHDTMWLADKARSLGARRINFHSFSPIGRGNNLQHEVLTPQEWGRFCDAMAGYKSALAADYDITDFVVDVELAYDYGISTGVRNDTCAIDDGFNLQFRPPTQGSGDCAVLACGLTMPDPNKSAYVFREGNLFQRYGDSEHRLVARPRACCPLPFRQQPEGSPQPICIYTRIDHALADQNAYRAPNTQWSILGKSAFDAYASKGSSNH
jgi:sulfatase maturation enzyme AslB (radical SAM superfamily)